MGLIDPAVVCTYGSRLSISGLNYLSVAMIRHRRADLLLVERGLFESRSKAQAAIAAGLVTANGKTVARPSDEISADAALQAQAPHPWVSRGGVKLAAALDHFGFDPSGRVCLDVGASTPGGFSLGFVPRPAPARA